MMEHAKYDVLALSDADVRVRPDYLRRTIAPLVKPIVGLTTCLYRGRGFFGLPSVVESLLINCDFVPMVLTAQYIGQRNALGASLCFKRKALDAMGGFPALADYLADDNMLGEGVKRAGYTVELLPYVVETILDSTTVADVWRHQVRWARTYRVLQPTGWFSSIVTHATTWGTAALVATGASPLGIGFFLTAIAVRLGTLRVIMRMLRERDTPRHLWMVPLKDLGFTAVWLASWLGHDVVWSGQRLRVQRDGKMVPIDGETLPAEPELQPGRTRAA
jgi:ceramide glucosyltransferase